LRSSGPAEETKPVKRVEEAEEVREWGKKKGFWGRFSSKKERS
jgi:hypothetical protein